MATTAQSTSIDHLIHSVVSAGFHHITHCDTATPRIVAAMIIITQHLSFTLFIRLDFSRYAPALANP